MSNSAKIPLIGKWNMEYAIINGKQINDVNGSHVIFMSNGKGVEYFHISSHNMNKTVDF